MFICMSDAAEAVDRQVDAYNARDVGAFAAWLNLPDDLDEPGATRPPWSTTLVTVEVPPDGWVMP